MVTILVTEFDRWHVFIQSGNIKRKFTIKREQLSERKTIRAHLKRQNLITEKLKCFDFKKIELFPL